jgi:hypothetical membrane protein
MVDSVDFDFHRSFLIISVLFTASVLVYREHAAPHGDEVC